MGRRSLDTDRQSAMPPPLSDKNQEGIFMGIISLKRTMSILCMFVLGMFFLTPLTEASQRTNLLDNVKTYKIYYDAPSKSKITKMQQYDLMIIEPVFYSASQIKDIKKNGTKVYGYINTMEADNWNVDFINQLHESDFFHREGNRVHYSEWDSYLTDITSTHYQSVLLKEIEKQIVAKGLDGVFLDTVGNIDNEHSSQPNVLEEQRTGMAQFLQNVKASHPSLSLIQNWGFGTLTTHTYPYVDGIMWESFNYGVVANDQWSKNRISELKTLNDLYNIKTLTVSSAQGTQSATFSRSNGFIHFHSNSTLNYNIF